MSSFNITASEGNARAGQLATASGPLATPALLAYTHRGGMLNLTPDLLENLQPELQGVAVDVLQFLTQPKPGVVQGFPGAGGGRQFLALDAPGLVVLASGRDPCCYEYAGAMRQATNEWASVTVHAGAAAVTPAQYVEAAAALGPDIWVALSDDIPSDSRSDRIAKAVDRTTSWLSACLAAAAATPGLARAAAFSAVQGGNYINERIRCAEAVAAQPGVAGYVVAGLGTGESPDQRRTIIAEVVARLPPAAPRMASGLGCPEEVLEAVSQGVDMFDSSYVAGLVAGGYALCFPVSPGDEAAQAAAAAAAAAAGPAAAGGTTAAGGDAATAAAAAAEAAAGAGQDDGRLNLWALAYRADKRPLLPGCSCFTCAKHTRAYVHHLLQAHEMTAQVLLEIHNTHHYLRFFAAMRAAIAGKRFADYRAWFLGRRQRWLVEGR